MRDLQKLRVEMGHGFMCASFYVCIVYALWIYVYMDLCAQLDVLNGASVVLKGR